MPVRTPIDAEQAPVAPMSDRLVTDIIEAYAAGMSASAIAAERNLGLRRVQRKLKLPESAARVRELRAEHQKRESARVRKASQRARDQEAVLNPAATVTSATRISRAGALDLYKHEESGIWYRTASVGWDVPATPGDFERRGATVPPDLYADPGFGPPYPELARHALGHVEPTTRVRLPPGHPANECSVEQTCSIPTVDLAQALAAGAVRA